MLWLTPPPLPTVNRRLSQLMLVSMNPKPVTANFKSKEVDGSPQGVESSQNKQEIGKTRLGKVRN